MLTKRILYDTDEYDQFILTDSSLFTVSGVCDKYTRGKTASKKGRLGLLVGDPYFVLLFSFDVCVYALHKI